MSQHPAQHESDQNTIAEEYVNFIPSSAVPKAMTLEEIKHHTGEDQTTQTVIDLVRLGRWNSINQIQDPSVSKTDLNVFLKVSQHLTAADDLILKGNKIVLPETLRLKAPELAHAPSHMGVTKVEILSREKVWCPYIDKQAKGMIDKCLPCQAAGPGKPPAPVKPSKLPPCAWHTLKADFLGPIPGTHQLKYLLVTVDCYSRFPKSKLSPHCQPIQSFPNLIEYLLLMEFLPRLRQTTVLLFKVKRLIATRRHGGYVTRELPLWSPGNAEAESFMHSLKKLLQTCPVEK